MKTSSTRTQSATTMATLSTMLLCICLALPIACRATLLPHRADDDESLHQRLSRRHDTLFLESYSASDYEPQQVHLSWTGEDGEMTVTWSTMKLPASDRRRRHGDHHHHEEEEFSVHFGSSSSHLDETAPASVEKFVDGGSAQHSQFIYRATMRGMQPHSTYYYTVGSTQIRSRQFKFLTMQAKADWRSPRIMVLGDLGTANDRSLVEMQREVDAGMHDLVFHNGDFAYDMDSDQGRRGDLFMRQIEPIASKLPYMVTVGNHEQAYNFSHYTNRFSMPGREAGRENLYYSLDMGPLHMLFFSGEMWFFPQYGLEQLRRQVRWMEEDLRQARERNTQWIVVASHRPLYCSTPDLRMCNPLGSLLCRGFPELNIPGVEELFYKYGVDFYYGAHEHSYERLWPTYKREVRNGTADPERPYHDALATIYVTQGAAGNDEKQTPFLKHPYKWSAFRSMAYGFMRMRVDNSTHMFVDEIGIDKDNGTHVIDRATISKTQPEPAWLRH